MSPVGLEGYWRKCPSVRARRQFTDVQQMKCIASLKESGDESSVQRPVYIYVISYYEFIITLPN